MWKKDLQFAAVVILVFGIFLYLRDSRGSAEPAGPDLAISPTVGDESSPGTGDLRQVDLPETLFR